MSRKIEVQIVGDASSLDRAFGHAGKQAKAFGGGIHTTMRAAGIGVAAAFGVMGIAAKGALDELNESTKVSAQTAAVLKSTGGAAHVTAKQIDSLSVALLQKSGVDDEAIKSGENLLLTFTGIRNETGKGNDVFNRATKTMLDMSVALGEDTKSAAIQLGKALNDPIKGITALQRVGVSFTADQKEQIKTLVEHGKTLEAQKLILGELNKEFGGSAEAAGKTFGGQLNIAKENLKNLGAELLTGAIPLIQKLAGVIGEATAWIHTHWPEIQPVISRVFAAIGEAWQQFGKPAFDALVAMGQFVVDWIRNNWPEISATARRVLTNLKSTIEGVVEIIKGIWQRFGRNIITQLETTWDFVKATVKNAMEVVRGIIDLALGLLHGDWARVWKGIQEVFGGAAREIIAIMQGLGRTLENVAGIIGHALWEGLKAGARGLLHLGAWINEKINAGIFAALSFAGDAAKMVGVAIKDGILDGLGGLLGELGDSLKKKIGGAIGFVKGVFGIGSPSAVTRDEIGKPLAEGVVVGWLDGTIDLPAKMKESVRKAIEHAQKVVEQARTGFQNAWSQLSGDALSAFDAIFGNLKTKSEKALDALTKKETWDRLRDDLKQAQADFAAALAEGDPAKIAEAQRAVADAELQITKQKLQEQAEVERLNLDARNALRRRHFDQALAALEESLAKHHVTVGEAHKRILALLASYGINFQAVGADMGAAWVGGLKESIGGAAQGAGALSSTISDVAERIIARRGKPEFRAGGGPVLAGMPYVVGEGGRELFVPNVPGRIVPNSKLGGRAPVLAGARGGDHYEFNFPNYLGERREISEIVRREIVRTKGLNVTSGL